MRFKKYPALSVAALLIALFTGLVAIIWPKPDLSPYESTLPAPLADAQASIQAAALSTLQYTGQSPELQSLMRSSLAMHTLGKEFRAGRWPQTTINVCWEASANQYAIEKSWTQSAVQKSWEAHSVLRFIGWGMCTNEQDGIHIEVADVIPEARKLGNELDKQNNGLILNFEMKKTKIACGDDREQCIRTIAVHEFGHAIGLVHEMYNGEVPDTCTLRSGPDGDHSLTPYDNESVMNYCNPLYGNLGKLSKCDIATVNKMYPPLTTNTSSPVICSQRP